MKPLALILAFAAVTSAQKSLKASKHKPAYIAHSPGAGAEAAPQYQQQAPQHPAISNHGGFGGGSGGHHGGGGGSYSSGVGKADSKRIFPQLLSDTRTLNPDGTINFDYKADNGLHQGESVDSDGTRRGFYSYPGADGKLLTVKYTAGKNGFVAEGPHLPTQPQSAPYNSKQDDIYSSGKQGSNFGGGLGGGHFAQGAPQHHGGGGGASQGAYRPSQGLGGGNHGQQASHYSHSSGLGGGSGGGGGGNAFANFPDFSSHFPQSSGGKHGGFGSGDSSSFIGFSGPKSLNTPNHHFTISHQPQAQNQINNVIGSPSYSSGSAGGGGGGAGRYSQGGAGGHQGLSAHPGGSSSFSSLGGLGGLGGGHGGSGASLADIQSSLGQAQYSGPMFTANNPYQPSLESANPANPVNAGFDLGNGGHFAINFSPGQAQEYNVNELPGGDYGGGQGGGHGGQVTNYGGGGSSGQGGGSGQGRY